MQRKELVSRLKRDKLLRRRRRDEVTRQVGLVFCWAVLTCILCYSGVALIFAKQAQGSGTAAQSSGAPGSAPAGPLTAEQRLQIQAAVDDAQKALRADIEAENARERALLDKLMAAVGLIQPFWAWPPTSR